MEWESPGPVDAGIMRRLAPLRYLWPSRKKLLLAKYYRKVERGYEEQSLGYKTGAERVLCKMLDMNVREFGLSEARWIGAIRLLQ
jgi:hypothetical protein